MFDLVSTREEVDPQTKACARLLAAVIADAIHNAAAAPTREEKSRSRNIDGELVHPGLSVWFLFDEESPFSDYARLIGISAQEVRDALLGNHRLAQMSKSERKGSLFSEQERRVVKIRHQWYRRQKAAEQTALYGTH